MVVNFLTLNKKIKPIKLNLNLLMYDIFTRYILQPVNFVKMEHLVNLRKLLVIIDPTTYENEPEKVKRVKFIAKGLEARLDNNINDRDLVLAYISGGLDFQVSFLDYNKLDLSRDEILYVHKMVSETLQYKFMYEKVDQFQDICTRFKTSDFETRGNIVKEFENLIDECKTEFRHTKVNDNSVDMTFSLKDGEFESAITNTWNMVTNPSRRLMCGMQGLNELVGGGFESGRVYMLLGTSGVGKSITLLNLIYQIKRFNKHYKTKDPTKTPCIVLLTMENTVVETITRLFSLIMGSGNMSNYSAQDCIQLLRSQGELMLNDSSPIDIVIKYKANRSIDTSYLYTLYDDLLDEGREMICLVQDHVKRIKSVYSNSDLRLELGDVVNELKVFAAEKDIPVLTNSHLNREAARIIEEASKKNNQDIGKLLGKSSTGESMLMIDNLDCALNITLDFDENENRYMAFNLTKMRDKPLRTYIAQPFVPGSTIRLLEDVGGIPQFKETIHGANEIKRSPIIKVSSASSLMGNADAVIDFEDRENSFHGTSYQLNEEVPKKRLPKREECECPVIWVNKESSDFQSELQSFKNDLSSIMPA